MANSSHKFTDKWLDSLGEQVDKGLTMKVGAVAFKTKEVQNGNVTIIQMTPEKPHNLITSNKDNGKQVARLSEAIPEEASGHESEASDEKREF